MRVLAADDDPVSRLRIETELRRWGHDVTVVADGTAAWAAIERDRPDIGLFDWMMPGLDGPELCRRIRATPGLESTYVILLTARSARGDVVAGLDAGADDYVVKPFDREELQARLQVGVRVVTLQRRLADRVAELEASLSRERHLQGLLPICAYCKRIRDDANYWTQVEAYISEHTDVRFSHGICPDCNTNIVRPEIERLRKKKQLVG